MGFRSVVRETKRHGGPIHVYLDSSDYSTMSNPGATLETQGVLQRLKAWSLSGEVMFVYSGVHLSEMAPLQETSVTAALLRTDLMVDLCGSNTLISVDRILRGELDPDRTTSAIQSPLDIRNSDGEWFPELDGLEFIKPIQGADLPFNRKMRRMLRQRIDKNGVPKESLLKVMDEFPMRPCDAEVIVRFHLGLENVEDARLAFSASLRDPRWLMRWFHKHSNDVSWIREWFRGPSVVFTKIAQDIVDQLDEKMSSIPGDSMGDGPPRQIWIANQDEMLPRQAANIQQGAFGWSREMTAQYVDDTCPSFSCFYRTWHSSLWNSVGTQKRLLKHSDVVDAAHAMYAPYVDVFRADGYMAPIIASNSSRFGTIVVPKLNQLVEVVEGLLMQVRT